MKTKEQIVKELTDNICNNGKGLFHSKANLLIMVGILEALIDIRDVLDEKRKVNIKNEEL